jgi:hypothetical protein
VDPTKYIMVLDDVIEKDFCDHLIQKFHSNKNLWINRDTKRYRFNELNLSNNKDLYENELNLLVDVYKQCTDFYRSKFEWLPKTNSFENVRMKHYPEGEGEFKPHIDASRWENMHRFLVFFLYLDEGEGGGTTLFDQNITVPRNPGRMLMFPPLWTYPHAGNMPTKNDKHIIGSYLHYEKV